MCIQLNMFSTGNVLKLKTVTTGAVAAGRGIYVGNMVINFIV
jgi:hypothetical protein